MSKLDKLKEILAVAGPMATPFLPGPAGSILDVVSKGLASHGDPASGASADAIKQLAAVNDTQTQAILILNDRIAALEAKLK